MIMQTITDYLDQTGSSTPFYGNAALPEYVTSTEFQNMLTDFMAEMYGDYRLRFKFEKLVDGQLTTAIQKACDNVYLVHAYTYKTLYDTTIAQYNPIENYNMVEHEETKNRGTDESTHSLGSHKDETSYGSHTDSTNFGESTLTDIYGNRETNTKTTGDVAPFETQSYQHVDQSSVNATENSATDKHTQSQRSDSTSYGGHTDTTEYGGRTDTDTLEHGHDITRDLTRSGNIGVTTTQQMLEQERLIAAMNLVRIVANDIVHAICICYMGV